MIKVHATINGVVCKPANIRTDHDGKKKIGFSVKLTVPGSRNNMPGKEVFIFVNKNGDENELGNFMVGSRIEVTGILMFRKVDDNLYFNFDADTVNFNPESVKDAIDGTLEFKGTIGKNIEEKNDKKGNGYVSFSAFSTEKVNDGFRFIWVRFVKFNYVRESFLQPKAKISATGKFSVSVYNSRIDLDCRADEIRPWERMPFSPSTNNG